MNVLGRDSDLLGPVVPERGEAADDQTSLGAVVGWRNLPTTSWTMSSGVDAPAVRPTVSCPSRIPGSTSLSSSTSAASAPASRATSTSRCAFELVSDPITRMSDASSASRFTASCRFWVA